MDAHETTGTTTQPTEDGFQPVQGGGTNRSGTILLVEAYVALWLLLMLFVWKTHARQRRIEARLEQLAANLEPEQQELE